MLHNTYCQELRAKEGIIKLNFYTMKPKNCSMTTIALFVLKKGNVKKNNQTFDKIKIPVATTVFKKLLSDHFEGLISTMYLSL